MPYVSIDDKITRVMPDYTICETVDGVTREGFATKSAPGLISLRHAGEGITWVRGWHLPDDEEVQAARVAQSLDENKEQTKMSTPQELGYPPTPSPWPGPPPGPPPGWIGTPVGIGIAPPPTTTDPALTQFPFGTTTC